MAALTLLGMSGFRLDYTEYYDTVSVSIGFNVAVKAGLIISAVLSVISIALICVANGKKFLSFAPMGKVLFFACAAGLAVVAVSFVCAYRLTYTSYSEFTEIGLSSGALIVFMQEFIQSFANVNGSKFVYTPYVLSYIAYMGLAISVGAFIATMYGSIIKKKGIAGVVTAAVITVCCAIFYVVAALSVKSDMDTLLANSKTSLNIVCAVVTTVLAVISAALGITGAIVGVTAKQDKTGENNK